MTQRQRGTKKIVEISKESTNDEGTCKCRKSNDEQKSFDKSQNEITPSEVPATVNEKYIVT